MEDWTFHSSYCMEKTKWALPTSSSTHYPFFWYSLHKCTCVPVSPCKLTCIFGRCMHLPESVLDCWHPLPLLSCHGLCSSSYLPKHCNATASSRLLSHVYKIQRVEKLLHLLWTWGMPHSSRWKPKVLLKSHTGGGGCRFHVTLSISEL